MNKVNNARYQNTEDKIQNAFHCLLEQKDFANISVNDICREANISRPSFYAHYEDINQLIVIIEQNKSEHISSFISTAKEITQESFQDYLNYIKENKNFYKAYFKTESSPAIANSMMQEYIKSHHLQNTSKLQYNMLFYMAGIRSVVREWITKKKPESTWEMAAILYEQYLHFDNDITVS